MSNIKNVLYMASVQVANYIFPLITIPIVSRVFGPGNIGVINYVAAIVGYFSLFVNYSFNYTAVRWLTRKPQDKDSLFGGFFNPVFDIYCLYYFLCYSSISIAKSPGLYMGLLCVLSFLSGCIVYAELVFTGV